jgi:hypothetical protein
MRRTDALLPLLLLAACQQGAGPAASGGASGSGLERAAIESGVVTDISGVSPVGLYSRRHEAGADSLCVMPGKDGGFRFGAQAMFGADERCTGKGTAKRAGDKLILSFSGRDRCIIVAQYEGDRVALPGVVDMKCNDLCEGRGSFEGVSFPRVASEASVAARDPLCGD